MGCVSSKIHVPKDSSSAPGQLRATFQRSGSGHRALAGTLVCNTPDEPLNPKEYACLRISDNLISSDNPEEMRLAENDEFARYSTNLIRHRASLLKRQAAVSQKESSNGCDIGSGETTKRPEVSSYQHRTNIQLLRDIMALEGSAINEEEAQYVLGFVKSDLKDKLVAVSKEVKESSTESERGKAGGIQDGTGGIVSQTTTYPTPRISLYKELKEVCLGILQENEKPKEEDKESVFDIDEASQSLSSENDTEEGNEPNDTNSTEELEATINAIFKRWNLSMPDDQGEFAKIGETVKSSISRAASNCQRTSFTRPATPDVILPITLLPVSKPTNPKYVRPSAARGPRVPPVERGSRIHGPFFSTD